MSDFNKMLLIGRLTAKPEIKTIVGVGLCCEGYLASNYNRTNKATGEKDTESTFIAIIAYDKVADLLHKNCDTGTKIFIEGRLKFECWKAQDGTKRSRHVIIVNSFELLTKPEGIND